MSVVSDTQPHARNKHDRPWYAKGLRFGCTRCNSCCTGPPGYVWVTEEEIARIAAFLKLGVAQFTKQYCRSVLWHVSLKERANGECVLLSPEGCRIYPARPLQCWTFPFWTYNLRSPQRWKALKPRCPGVDTGKLYGWAEIERIAAGEHST